MTDQHRETRAPEPCGYGIFHEGVLLVAFPSLEKAREVLQECEREGYQTGELALRAVFAGPAPGEMPGSGLEAQIREARDALDAALRQRDEIQAALLALREQI